MIALVAWRNVSYRPWRSLLLFAGYAIGVAVMIVLLSIGDALLIQSSDERLVGGGDITVLPEGIDVEVMKTGGLGGMFFSIDNSRFIHRQVLGSPRFADDIAAVAPQIEGKLLYLTVPARSGAGAAEYAVRAAGEIPSANAAVGAAPVLAAGAWEDNDADRRWLSPSLVELRHEIDRFHIPPASLSAEDARSWGEWHYFNVLSDDGKRWAFISLIVGGDVRGDEWGGQVLVTVHEDGRRERRFVSTFAATDVEFSTERADVRVGSSTVTVLPNGDYALRARAREQLATQARPAGADAAGGIGAGAMSGAGPEIDVELVVSPVEGAYFPGASLGSGDFISGYTVPALRANASGRICVADRCETYDNAQGYHDHNWGVWAGVSWEWGSGRAGSYSFLYGAVRPPEGGEADTPLFLYLVDSLGFRALFRPQRVVYEDAGFIPVGGESVQRPVRAVMMDIRGADTLRLELEVEDVAVTDMRLAAAARGDSESGAPLLTRPFFLQMKGIARLSGRIAGDPVRGEGRGFFETYR